MTASFVTVHNMGVHTMSADIYAMVTDVILAELAKGVVPWRKPWTAVDGSLNRNMTSGKPYRGINQLLLSMMPYATPYWLTFKQAQAKGGAVRKGEKSTLVVFYKPFQVKDDKDPSKVKTVRMLRYYRVFNAEQCDNITVPEPPSGLDFQPCERADLVISGMPQKPPITHGGDRACYIPQWDEVHLPLRESFTSEPHYYSTAFHELAHSTGHQSRLNRDEITKGAIRFGDADYGREELVAEMSAAMLNATCGLFDDTRESSAAYLDHWTKQLSGDPKLIVQAAGKAQRAADFIQGITFGD